MKSQLATKIQIQPFQAGIFVTRKMCMEQWSIHSLVQPGRKMRASKGYFGSLLLL